MLRNNSPFGNDTSSYTDSILSNGFSMVDDASSHVSNLSRPNAKSIYLQRKDYVASINKMMDKFHYRVEHLFTCDLDGKELRSIDDCVERLKLLDGMGRVWGQNMMLEVRGPKLLLTDIETRTELESMALSDVLELKAVLDSGPFNSLLTVSVQPKRKHTTTVFMFQCEDVRADLVQRDLSRALSRREEDSSVSSNAEVIAAAQGIKSPPKDVKSAEPEEQKPAVVHLWTAPEYGESETGDVQPAVSFLQTEEDEISEPDTFVPEEREVEPPPEPYTTEEETTPLPRPYTELDRNVDILNHILNDVEIFMGQIAATVAKNAKKKKKKKGKTMDGMPPAAEFATCLQKIKCGFNLLVELNGKINNPSVPEFVHSIFSTLAFVVSHCPEDLPQTIVAPLLTPQCVCLLSEEATTEEDQLWQSLGDSWNIPSTKWPDDDEDIPTYTLEFFDGWQPPEVSAMPEVREPVSRRDSAQSAPSQAKQTSEKWNPPQNTCSGKSKLQRMRVKRDFISRNARELTVRKGEIVELLDVSKLWWNVRDSRGEEGFVPSNVLEPDDKQPVQQIERPPVLTKKSKPAEVKAWLEDKGFSKITVRCLDVLSGSALLGMSREELKALCPEEGGRVFFQLQAVKSATSAAS